MAASALAAGLLGVSLELLLVTGQLGSISYAPAELGFAASLVATVFAFVSSVGTLAARRGGRMLAVAALAVASLAIAGWVILLLMLTGPLAIGLTGITLASAP